MIYSPWVGCIVYSPVSRQVTCSLSGLFIQNHRICKVPCLVVNIVVIFWFYGFSGVMVFWIFIRITIPLYFWIRHNFNDILVGTLVLFVSCLMSGLCCFLYVRCCLPCVYVQVSVDCSILERVISIIHYLYMHIV